MQTEQKPKAKLPKQNTARFEGRYSTRVACHDAPPGKSSGPGTVPTVCASLALLALLLLSTSFQCLANSRPQATTDFDRDWRFHLGDIANGPDPALDDSGWRLLDLPHDWSIEGEFSDKNPATPGGGALPG